MLLLRQDNYINCFSSPSFIESRHLGGLVKDIGSK